MIVHATRRILHGASRSVVVDLVRQELGTLCPGFFEMRDHSSYDNGKQNHERHPPSPAVVCLEFAETGCILWIG